MKREMNHGFLIFFLLDLLYRSWWLAFVAALIVLHFLLHWPLWLIVIPLVFWVLHALIESLIVLWGNRGSQTAWPKQENKNPYSKKE